MDKRKASSQSISRLNQEETHRSEEGALRQKTGGRMRPRANSRRKETDKKKELWDSG
jgi:hypothetical protein